MQVTAKISLYDCRCVNPHTANTVITAPLCGNVSIPPDAIDATRCNTSCGIPAASAAAIKFFAIAASAIDKPPEADPVMPASEVTVTASLTSGLGIEASASRIAIKPGNAAITAPNPYSDAVFIDASSAPPMAGLLPSANRPFIVPNANTNTHRMPISNAPSTAQIA